MAKTKIHFVCRGNVFRSRLAEAYAKSLKYDDWDVSSSGIVAEKYPTTFLSPWDKLIGTQHNLNGWFSDTRAQTSTQLLNQSDIIVFMSRDVYLDASKHYDFNPAVCLTWHVKDRGDWHQKLSVSQKRQRTFKHIKRNVDQLIKDVSRGGWVDIVDESNQTVGIKLPITIANQKKLWHRGCHALITTPENYTLVQKRSNTIIFSPNLIDVSLGGHVDISESPEQAVVREIREEIGLSINPASLRLLEVYKWSSYHPRYKRYSRSFIYTYHVAIPESIPVITIQEDEVKMVKLLSPRQLRRLIAFHSMKHLGRLNYAHAYYLRIIKLAGIY